MRNDNEKIGTVRDADAEKENGSKNNIVGKNLIPKILCVVAAFVLWLYVMQVESPEYTETISSVAVSLQNTSVLQSESGLSVYNGGNERINVELSGKKSVVSGLKSDDIKAYADVSRIKEAGRHSLDVYVDLPDGVSIVKPEPSTVTVFADETKSVSLPIKEKMGNMVLTSPYELGTVQFMKSGGENITSVNVTGPGTIIDTLSEAQVNVNMEGKTSSFVTRSPLTIVNLSGDSVDTTYLSMSVAEIDVKVPIYVTKELPLSVSFKHGLIDPKLVKMKVTPEKLTVRGDETIFTETENIVQPIVIDEKMIMSNQYTVTVRPTLPADIIVDSADTEVTVTVELDSSLRTKQITVEDFQVTGAAKDLKYEILTSALPVTLRGTLEELNDIKASDVSVVLDLSGYDSSSRGTVSLNAAITVDAEKTDSIYELGEYTVQVKLN